MDHQEDVTKVIGLLPELVKKAGYDELYGYQMDPKGEFYDAKIAAKLVYKMLKAYGFDIEQTKTHLVAVMKWRGKFDPLSAAFLEKHDPKFDRMGCIIPNKDGPAGEKLVTWNFYGAVGADPSEIFGNVDKFVRWRVGLMERAVQMLDFADPDNDYMVQVHDYEGASMLSMTGDTKKASTSIIKLFGDFYPEVLSKKFFVNVPMLMAFLFGIMQKFVAEATRRKLTMIRDGTTLGTYLKGSGVPKKYGGVSGKGVDELRFVYEKGKIKLPEYVTYILEGKVANEVD